MTTPISLGRRTDPEQHAQRVRDSIVEEAEQSIERLAERTGRSLQHRMPNPRISHMIEDGLTDLAENICIAAEALANDHFGRDNAGIATGRALMDEQSDEALDATARNIQNTDWTRLEKHEAQRACRAAARDFLKDWAERTETAKMAGPPEQQEMLIEAQAIMLTLAGESAHE